MQPEPVAPSASVQGVTEVADGTRDHASLQDAEDPVALERSYSTSSSAHSLKGDMTAESFSSQLNVAAQSHLPTLLMSRGDSSHASSNSSFSRQSSVRSTDSVEAVQLRTPLRTPYRTPYTSPIVSRHPTGLGNGISPASASYFPPARSAEASPIMPLLIPDSSPTDSGRHSDGARVARVNLEDAEGSDKVHALGDGSPPPRSTGLPFATS